MNKTIINTLLITSLMGNYGLAVAQNTQDQSRMFIYGGYGTQGGGVGAGYVINDKFSMRLGLSSGGDSSGKRRIDDIRYSLSRKTDESLQAVLDWYPLNDKGLRLSGGLYLIDSNSNLIAKQDSAGNYTINNTGYASSEVGILEGTVSSSKVSPYLGVGWDTARPGKSGLRFFSDVGVIHHQSRKVSLTTSGSLNTSQLQSDLQAENGRIEDVNDISIAASIGISYSF